MAIQILYQKDFANQEEVSIEVSKIKKDIIENYVLDCDQDISSYKDKIDEKFLDNLLGGVLQILPNLDQKISDNLKEGWEISSIDSTLLQIMRCGIFELSYMKNIPSKVVVDEYVSIAASFFDEKKVKFVNATLDKIAKSDQ